MIPSKPLIPRRNSATKPNGSSHFNNDDEFLKNLNADTDTFNNELKNFFSSSSDYSSKKYDTMPNMRVMSAKNRKKIEKLFSLSPHTHSADKVNDISSSRYTPSNTESGIYSMSDYDNNNGGTSNAGDSYHNNYLQTTNLLNPKKQSMNRNTFNATQNNNGINNSNGSSNQSNNGPNTLNNNNGSNNSGIFFKELSINNDRCIN